LSGMQGNLHVPFLGGWAGAIPPGYPADEETYPQGNAPCPYPTRSMAHNPGEPERSPPPPV
jgi:hypothetical protein